MSTLSKWDAPQTIDDVTYVFPANAVRDLMPTMEECETGLNALSDSESNKWRAFQNEWFFEGLPPTLEVDLHDGIDGKNAFRHLHAIQGSYAPKHEHKVAAVAYLSSLWFRGFSVAAEGESEGEGESASASASKPKKETVMRPPGVPGKYRRDLTGKTIHKDGCSRLRSGGKEWDYADGFTAEDIRRELEEHPWLHVCATCKANV